MSTAEHAFANGLRYVQGVIREAMARKRGETADRGGYFDPNSEAAQYYEGFYDGLLEADRIVAEIINQNARDGRVVR